MTGITLDSPTASAESRLGVFPRVTGTARFGRRWTPGLLLALVWGAAGIFVLVQAAVLGRLSGAGHLGRAGVVTDILFLMMWALATPAILRSASWLPLVRPHLARRMFVHLVLATAFVLGINLVGPFLLRLALGMPLEPASALREGVTGFVRIFHLALVVYAFILGVGHYLQVFAARRAEEERVAALRIDLAEARQALQTVAGLEAGDPRGQPSYQPEIRENVLVGSSGSAVENRVVFERAAAAAFPTHDRAAVDARALPRTGPLAIKDDGRLRLVEQSTIDWVEADDDHVVVHAGSVAWRTRETLRDVERRLDPSQFVRIHRSTIVQMSRIREIEPWFRGDFVVVLQSGAKLRLSRNHRERLESVLGRQL